MAYKINLDVNAVESPPIAESAQWVAGREFPPEKPLLDLAQAVPRIPPPPAMREYLARMVREDGVSGYTDILGIPALRAAFAAHIAGEYQGEVTAAQVAITTGCNQAFCLAVQAIGHPGDEVILPAPYYFNHFMWLKMLGLTPVLLPFQDDANGIPSPEQARALITPRTRALVLVTPNNPTGAIYPPKVLDAFYALARDHQLALILDETYKDFLDGEDSRHHLFQDAKWPETLIQLYSFSKAYSLSGYRVGTLVADTRLLEQVAKLADCVTICPPRIGQEAALYGLRELAGWRRDNRDLMRGRGQALREALTAHPSGFALVSLGAYFAYVRHPFPGHAARVVARHLADSQNVLTLPGSTFGPGQEAFLRLAFANLEGERMPELARRLQQATTPP